METIVCAADERMAQSVARFSPDFIAVEPPELIGGDISVTTAKPEVVRSAVNAVNRINPNVRVLCGAGVKTGEDARMALELGADGILLASGVVKSKEKELVVDELARAVERA
jgi:triosephosphate isomerase